MKHLKLKIPFIHKIILITSNFTIRQYMNFRKLNDDHRRDGDLDQSSNKAKEVTDK